MESDFGVAKVEWSAVVCVCVYARACVHACELLIHHCYKITSNLATHITTALHSTFATPKSESTPILGFKTTVHRIHNFMSNKYSMEWSLGAE